MCPVPSGPLCSAPLGSLDIQAFPGAAGALPSDLELSSHAQLFPAQTQLWSCHPGLR